ncbi:hypothetical protein [Ornithinibacillus halotolerans]|uniref:Uncharacterized protein n=1 Tax=Ornithinibacillus halotolerans TaxID=1274357 RepID=A0A916S1I5_9BACI|nr:hypothetical protein [Ornithinibacillus halotolerans]GGA80179.1 hypothetical protein GCM10008025_24470 [Ornithinibacillus halotolerans]
MKQKEEFISWLNNHTKLSPSTSEKYAGAINTISKELKSYNLIDSSLYYFEDPVIIETYKLKYLSIEEFKVKDSRGNRMYSNALKRYKEYLESK